MIKLPYFLTLMLTMGILFNCSHQKNGVYLNELPTPPVLAKQNGVIQLHLENSIKHSARSIYKLETSVKDTKIQIRAYQKLSNLPFTKYRNDFTIDIQEFGFASNTQISIIWVDPDGSETELVKYTL